MDLWSNGGDKDESGRSAVGVRLRARKEPAEKEKEMGRCVLRTRRSVKLRREA